MIEVQRQFSFVFVIMHLIIFPTDPYSKIHVPNLGSLS